MAKHKLTHSEEVKGGKDSHKHKEMHESHMKKDKKHHEEPKKKKKHHEK